MCLVVAGIAAVFAVVVSVNAQANVVFALANAAIAIALAFLFLRAACQTVVGTGHGQNVPRFAED